VDQKPPERPAAAPRRRKLGKRLLLASMSGLIAIATVELVLWLVGFSYHLYPEKIEFGSPTPEQIDSGFLADRDLLWVTKDYFQKLDAARATRPDVVFIGDSCTEWGNYERYFDGLIQQNFPKANYTYATLGVPAWSSYQGLRQLERDVLPLRPSVITVYFGWNDHWKGFGIEDKDVAWVNSSMLFQLQKYSRIAQLVTKAYIGMTRDADAPLLRVSPEDFRGNLTKMARLAKANGIKLVLMTAPTSHEKGKEPGHLQQRHVADLSKLIPLHQEYVSIVRDVARSEGVILCDLARVFAKFSPERLRTKLFEGDGIHLLDEGDQVIAVELYQCFQQFGLLQRIL
jgi:lysophospholipase L1-like esterase